MPYGSRYQPHPKHIELGVEFYDPVKPAPFPSFTIRFKNQKWAKEIGLDNLSDEEWINHFGRFEPLPKNLRENLALRYHGHQFQHYNPEIGDGRGFLFAQVKEFDPPHRLLDLATKGSGQTPYSRQGDGRLTLKGAVREILATEMLEAWKVNTSKTFSVIETGESLQRNDEPSPTRSAVLVRLSHSHIRFGSFQRLAFFEQVENIKKLCKYSCEQYFPELLECSEEERILRLFESIVRSSAQLTGQWMMAGFVHGVLNTDNLVITGESFDYGPYRFLPHYDPQFTAAYFDQEGLYSFARQPEAVHWNLHQLGHSLSFAQGEMNDYIDIIDSEFSKVLDETLLRRFFWRLNLQMRTKEEDRELLKSCFDFLRSSKVGFDEFFFDWNGGLESKEFALQSERNKLYSGESFQRFFNYLQKREVSNKNLLIHLRQNWDKPESLLIDEIEEIWAQIDQNDQWESLNSKLEKLRKWGELWSLTP